MNSCSYQLQATCPGCSRDEQHCVEDLYAPENCDERGNLIDPHAYRGRDWKVQLTAKKYDSGKPQLSQISLELLETLASVRMFGETKYSRANWQNGFQVTRSLDAALRHINQFLSGVTNDYESGLCHLGHAVASLEHAIFDLIHHPENDNRDRNDKEKPCFLYKEHVALKNEG